MRKQVILLLILCFAFYASAFDVKVNLFTGQKVTSFTVNHVSGRYLLVGDEYEISTISQGEGVTFRASDTLVEMIVNGVVKYSAREFRLSGLAFNNIFALGINGFPLRQYDDNLTVRFEEGELRLINVVDLEKYVGGVIQAEAGGSTNLVEYFMVQAIVSRTYAVRLIRNNGAEFCLTDDVSNQVYKGRPVKKEIFEAVARTTGEVVLFDDTNLINAVFHSNSGGLTMASNEVWVSALPYLKPVVDSFSIGQRNYNWTHKMPVVDWLNYLDKTHGFPVHDEEMKSQALNYVQLNRGKFFMNEILLTRIRGDLKLKSTFFDISVEHDMVVFSGKGYGHGVGLSQEGAIRMAELGYSPHDILRFYYAGVSVRPITDIVAFVSMN